MLKPLNRTIIGNSNKKEFIYCCICNEKFSWLKARKISLKGVYEAICRRCRLEEEIEKE